VLQTVFYADGVLLGTDSEAPFELKWIPSAAAAASEHSITAVATDDSDLTVQSEPLIIYTDDASITRFEAERAVITGQAGIISSAAASGGKYVELRNGWTITFNNIVVPVEGDYLLTIGYQCTFQPPKSQYLVVNGDTLTVVEFTALAASSWMQKGIRIRLQAGTNSIALHGYWNWMSLDFIGVRGVTVFPVDKGKREKGNG
jgi:hypothetical protein